MDRQRVERFSTVPPDELQSEVEAAGEGLGTKQLRALILNLLFAGRDTTKSLLASGLWTLVSHPHELARLQSNLAFLSSSVEEIARFETPIPSISRTEIHEALFERGFEIEPLVDQPGWTAFRSTHGASHPCPPA